ncbi:MAG: hypothetical protein LDL41_07225 [Coleofasciculus sp. S288]|nr:hypothetical protein [Coleofasciculus sp. S288]
MEIPTSTLKTTLIVESSSQGEFAQHPLFGVSVVTLLGALLHLLAQSSRLFSWSSDRYYEI